MRRGGKTKGCVAFVNYNTTRRRIPLAPKWRRIKEIGASAMGHFDGFSTGFRLGNVRFVPKAPKPSQSQQRIFEFIPRSSATRHLRVMQLTLEGAAAI
jgi:hypothetical protein